MNKAVFAGILLVPVMCLSAYADSIIRVQCDDEDSGTEIYVNGKFVGECPVDVPVKAGTLQLRARKEATAGYERIFEKKIRVVDDVAQRVEVVLSAPQLTHEGKQKQDTAEADAQLRAAEAGNIAAMLKIAEYYDAGTGVKKSQTKAKMWRDKAESETAKAQIAAANNGNLAAMEDVADRYNTGRGVGKDRVKANAWLQKIEATKLANAAAQRAQQKQARLNAVSFDENTSKMVKNSGVDNNNVFEILTTGIPVSLSGMVSDILSAPTKTTERQSIKNEAALRPSTWGKPDSMIARASQQYEQSRPAAVQPILVATAK